uniref:ATP-dependent DNA helicase n=1 Tax=Fagus sylvatica TaxID=28930 RepID=A0A2N9GSG7_FAGSY
MHHELICWYSDNIEGGGMKLLCASEWQGNSPLAKQKYAFMCMFSSAKGDLHCYSQPHISASLAIPHASSSCHEIDNIISAELPDKLTDPGDYEAVKQYMIHGPCGAANPRSPCMVDNKCMKHFPKKVYNDTVIDEDGYPIYRRRDDGKMVEKNGVLLDNRFVVPYNIDLLVKYQAHINVEWCNRSKSIKYLFKYVNKGSDRATFVLYENVHTDTASESHHITNIDEIKTYLDCRYISASEACWRLFEFDIQYREPAVERLSFHLEDEQIITFKDSDYLDNVLQRPDITKTKFTEWMKTNEISNTARSLTYCDFPTKWVWHRKDKEWRPRKSGRCIGRIFHAHPTSGERFYLRMLLNVVKGASSFKEIRTVDGVVHPNYRTACYAHGLLDGDKEWDDAIKQASNWASGRQLRELFATLLMFCEVSDPHGLWVANWELLSDDILYRQKRILMYEHIQLTDEELQNHALFEIEQILAKSGRSLKEFDGMRYPNMSAIRENRNRLLEEELDFDRVDLVAKHLSLLNGLNVEQRKIYDIVIEDVATNSGGLYFVYGHGGTGKTYLWKTLISCLRSQGQIVLAMASSGIAALLLPGGRTAHSRLQIPIIVTEESTCGIKQGTHAAELMTKVSLIIWDEAPMAHRYCFEAVDRSLRDILRFTNTNSVNKPFGGKTVVLGGDFRQILPVVPKGQREDIVDASINRSYLWKFCKVFTLTQNMRLQQCNEDCKEFAEWILTLGNGEVDEVDNHSNVVIPSDLLIDAGDHPIHSIVIATYPDLHNKYIDGKYLEERSILAPTNDIVNEINDFMIDLLSPETETYFSADSICKSSSYIHNEDVLYPVEFLNSLKFPGIPNHKLRLAVGLPIMLLRNLNQSNGLCNGTRLVVSQLSKWVIEAKIITGSHVGQKVFIPRIVLSPSETKWPFVLKRRQFPVCVCFAMTINKSQGQSLKHVGLFLPKPVFSHGQLYVAVSRVTTRNGLKILITDTDSKSSSVTKNIVYKEVWVLIKWVMEAVKILLCVVALFLLGNSYAEPTSCGAYYNQGGAPAVIENPLCSTWVISRDFFGNHTVNCHLAAGTIKGPDEDSKDQFFCDLDLQIPFRGESAVTLNLMDLCRFCPTMQGLWVSPAAMLGLGLCCLMSLISDCG